MKRVKKIIAVGSYAKVSINLKVETTGHLGRNEIEHLIDSLADSIMSQIPGTHYLQCPLSKIKVS